MQSPMNAPVRGKPVARPTIQLATEVTTTIRVHAPEPDPPVPPPTKEPPGPHPEPERDPPQPPMPPIGDPPPVPPDIPHAVRVGQDRIGSPAQVDIFSTGARTGAAVYALQT